METITSLAFNYLHLGKTLLTNNQRAQKNLDIWFKRSKYIFFKLTDDPFQNLLFVQRCPEALKFLLRYFPRWLQLNGSCSETQSSHTGLKRRTSDILRSKCSDLVTNDETRLQMWRFIANSLFEYYHHYYFLPTDKKSLSSSWHFRGSRPKHSVNLRRPPGSYYLPNMWATSVQQKLQILGLKIILHRIYRYVFKQIIYSSMFLVLVHWDSHSQRGSQQGAHSAANQMSEPGDRVDWLSSLVADHTYGLSGPRLSLTWTTHWKLTLHELIQKRPLPKENSSQQLKTASQLKSQH